MAETSASLTELYDRLTQLIKQQDMLQFRPLFLGMHVYEQSQFYLDLSEADRAYLYQMMSPEEMGNIFDNLTDETDVLSELLAEMLPIYAAEVINEMYTDNAVEVLQELPKAEVTHYLSLMPAEDSSELREMLHYDKETAGSIMSTDFVAIVAHQTVQSVMTILKTAAPEAETIYYMYVTDAEDHLVGVLSLRDLIVCEDDQLISDIMNTRIISVKVGDEQEDVAKTMRDYTFLAMPVTDYEMHLEGIIMLDDILDVIDDEAASDYSGLAGVNVEDVSEKPIVAASKRLPWLITLLFLGMSTATLISHYEVLVSEASILAVFISLITGTAGNAGTQSLAVAVRRLAFKDERELNFGKLIFSEILTGLFTGLITGIVIMLVVGIWQGNFPLGLVIGLAMLAAITVANLAGSLIPMLMDRIGFDPAVASGPFITTLSDLTSVLIYFNIAKLFMGYFIHQ